MRVRRWDGTRSFAFKFESVLINSIRRIYIRILSPRSSLVLYACHLVDDDKFFDYSDLFLADYIFSEDDVDISDEVVLLNLRILLKQHLEELSQLELF